MKHKMLLTGVLLAIAASFAGCNTNSKAINQPQTTQQAEYISIDTAQAIALTAANVTASDAVLSSSTLDEVAGIICYKIAFTSGDNVYAYSINAISGEVLEASCIDKKALSTDTSQTNTPGAVDKEKAKEIALNHAGMKAAEVTITKARLDYEDGQQVYEIEWYINGAKYEYEISAADGKVVKHSYEGKTVARTGNEAVISEKAAKQTILACVEGAAEKDICEWEFDYDSRHPEYEGKIIYGNKEYEFTIDALSGIVTEFDVEVLNR